MPDILAIDTATDICSVGLKLGGELDYRSENIPRQHSQRLFGMLRELLPHGIRERGIELIAYNHGPGSFTGLRIAASAVQGLAFSNELPVAGISTLACLAEGARRRGDIVSGEAALVLLDARLNEVYWAWFTVDGDRVLALSGDAVSRPMDLPVPASEIVAIGSGLQYRQAFPSAVEEKIVRSIEGVWPDVRDLLALAELAWQDGDLLSAQQVIPVYLRGAGSWKKLTGEESR